MGSRAIAEFFIGQGVTPPICALAMLGRTEDVRSILADHPEQSNARGAHGIPIMYHAALSGNVTLAELLKNAGCSEGYNSALHGAIAFRHLEMVVWLLANGVTDVRTPDYENKTPLDRAQDSNQAEIVQMLQQFQNRVVE